MKYQFVYAKVLSLLVILQFSCSGTALFDAIKNFHALVAMLNIRGGVEDTRLEAKAKDTKKIRGQGQGQPFRGQTPSRPRTGMLEAKAKDQGHSRKCSPKKRSSKSFSGNLQFIGVARIFDWGGLKHKSHAMTSSKICLFLT